MDRYLRSDYTGEASGIEYGKKGDKVKLIRADETIALVQGRELFHIRVEKLSEDPIDPEVKPVTKDPVTPTRTQKKKRITKQSNLF